MDTSDFAQLNNLVREFEKLDSQIYPAIETYDSDKISEAIEKTRQKKIEIKTFMADRSYIPARGDLAFKLRKIRDNYGYSIDIAYDFMSETEGKKIHQEDDGVDDLVDHIFAEGLIDYIGHAYHTRRQELGTLVLSNDIPINFSHNLAKIQECYSLGLTSATVIYCRAVIEAAAHNFLSRKKPKAAKTSNFWERNLAAALKEPLLKKKVDAFNLKEAFRIKNLANDLLHNKNEKFFIKEDEAFDCVKSTFAFVEDILS